MIRRLVTALDDRLGIAPFLRKALRKAFPDHWSFMLGEIALYAFVFLVLTGVFLGYFFDASGQHVAYHGQYRSLQGTSLSAAFASVLRISFDTRAGLFIRQMHHWAALLFVAAIIVHMCRIFFTGAFRRPRELNWIVGFSLLVLALAAGFTGYSLPDDLLSGTGLRIAYSVAISIPLVGTYVAYLFFGGAFPAPDTTNRLFITHILVLPTLIAGAMALHLIIIWRQKHTQFAGPGRTESNVMGSALWPNYAMKSVGLGLAVFAVIAALGGVFQINPVWLYGPFDPWNVSSPAQPDWYVGWLEGALRLGPSWEFHIFGHDVPPSFFPGVALPSVLLAILLCWPFIERWVTHDGRVHQLLDHPSDAPVRTAIGAAILAFSGVLTLAGSDDVQAKLMAIPVESLASAYKILLMALPVVVGILTYQLALEVRRRRSVYTLPPGRIVISRAQSGGFIDEPEGGEAAQ